MHISKFGLIERILSFSDRKLVQNSPSKKKNTNPLNFKDQISISLESVKKFSDIEEKNKIKDSSSQSVSNHMEQMRRDKVNDLKAKINDPEYMKSINYDVLIQKIMKSLFDDFL